MVKNKRAAIVIWMLKIDCLADSNLRIRISAKAQSCAFRRTFGNQVQHKNISTAGVSHLQRTLFRMAVVFPKIRPVDPLEAHQSSVGMLE